MKSAVILIRDIPWTIVLGLRSKYNLGVCDYAKQTIYLKRGRKDTRDTLVHEVLHAALPDISEQAVDETAAAVDRALCVLDDWEE